MHEATWIWLYWEIGILLVKYSDVNFVIFSCNIIINTLDGYQLDDALISYFLYENCCFSIQIPLNIFPSVQIKINPALNQIMVWRRKGNDDVIKWKHFPRYWPFVWEIRWSPVNSPHKGQWRGALMFSLICLWINGCANSRDVGDLRRHRAHYDVIVMSHRHDAQMSHSS